MNRFRIGTGLLVLLLALSLGVQVLMQKSHAPIAAALSAAGENARSGHWEAAKQYSDSAADRWQKNWPITAALADHGPMEDIDSLMAQLPVRLHQQDADEFSSLCAELIRRIHAMSNAHRLSWWNIL